MSAACVNCTHWDRAEVNELNHAVSLAWPNQDSDHVAQRINSRFGLCTGIHEGWDLTVEEAETVKAVVWDGSSYKASINTREDFSCALFEVKP
jgi:hypothetical protein